MQKSISQSTQATNIGHIASEILSIEQVGSVLGVTSRGIFLETSGRWLIFVSFERFRSPLTVTLGEISAELLEVKHGMPVDIASGLLSIKDANVVIATQNSQVWCSKEPVIPALAKPERLAKLTDCANIIRNKKPVVGLVQFLPLVLGLPGKLSPSDRDRDPWSDDLLLLPRYITSKEADPIIGSITKLLGLGQGLTPSGDDFVTGLLLALNRWQDVLWSGDSLLSINIQVVEAAYRMTTTLSANLIELATLGQGDERLIKAVDCFMSGIPHESEALGDLLDWGHSSGVDAFVGMAAALSA